MYPIYHGGWRLSEVNTTLRRADGTVFVSATDREWAMRTLRLEGSRAVAIPNGLPDAFFNLSPPMPRSPGAPLGIAVVGAWIERKGSRVIAAAARELEARGVKVRWLLLGTHGDAAAIADEFPAAARDPLRVIPKYSRHDLPRLLADSQVYLLPSWSEGFSMSLVEAMACGLAPVATDVGDAREFVGAGTGVLLSETADAREIADAIVMLDRAPHLEALRLAAQHAVKGLRWSAIVDRAIAFYELRS
jgi:glycosyltransferase involved in cell wall biosynthesis